MFLVRTAFWLAIIIMILPTDAQNQREIYGAAKAAVSDIGNFCMRNPDVCKESKAAFEKFSQKAEFGAKLVMQFVTNKAGEDAARAKAAGPAPAKWHSSPSQNTLREDDLVPLWGIPNNDLGT